jgi:conjugative relaxase-like TrwC/TraI family protein
MLSVANVRTAGGAANYFAADNCYTRADADRSGEWFGQGAKGLGLDGRVEAKQFEAILKGYLPDGTRLGSDLRPHRAGTDLTFSMPKSWSLIALVGGDTRIIDVYAQAVKETLGWAEKHLAETRMEVKGQEKVVATGNLLVSMFRHDTNRNQEPNAHFHAVVANATKGSDGKWRALKNDKLWEHNTLLNAMTMARFRLSVEKLGYEVGEQGKHGNFEAKGVPKEIRDAFSSRRAEIVGALSNMDNKGLAARNTANLITRKAKAKIEDRAALARTWAAKADQLGFDPSALIARANARAVSDIGHVASLTERVVETAGNVRDWATGLAERLGLSKSDPLIPRALGKRSKEQVAAIHAVASAVLHLGEREAVLAKTAIYKVALDFGLPTALPQIEERIAQLLRQGHLVAGKDTDRGMVTIADALALEQRIINAVDEGRNRIAPIVAPDIAGERLQALSELKYGMTLNHGHEGAGRLILSSHNRIIAIQGIAGAGKSTVLKPVADILREERSEVLGLAVQNTLVQMLERDTGIPSMTVARFLKRHASLLVAPDPLKLMEARAKYRGSVILLDEASMVGNADKEKLVRLANLLEVDRFASIGDRKQLGAVDAGKPFDVMQKAGVETAIMNLNIRARDKTLRAAQHAAQGGNVSEKRSIT